MEIVYCMVSELSMINLFLSFLIIAIADGIMENKAFKHTAGDLHNETWTQLLLDFGFLAATSSSRSDDVTLSACLSVTLFFF